MRNPRDNALHGLQIEILGRGKGDPDVYGYPGEKQYIGEDKPVVEHHNADSEIEFVDENGKFKFGEVPF